MGRKGRGRNWYNSDEFLGQAQRQADLDAEDGYYQGYYLGRYSPNLSRGGDLYDSAMGNITGGNLTLNNNGYEPTPGVDHITVYDANNNHRVSWNTQNGQLAPDQYGNQEPHINSQGKPNG